VKDLGPAVAPGTLGEHPLLIEARLRPDQADHLGQLGAVDRDAAEND
jgi:hypothetical protein